MSVSTASKPSVPQRVRHHFWSSTVGKKSVMAVTGAVLLVYVLAHMLGNLKVFFGADSIDGYGRFLREFLAPVLGYGGLVWLVRVGLVVAVVLHMTCAIQLARRARAARPIRYAHRPRVHGSYSARTMRWGGVIIALFVVYHILDLTALTLNPHGVEGEIHANVVADFQRWYVVLAYTLAVVALGFHLRHGVSSAVRSLGAVPRPAVAEAVALGFALVVTVGFLSVPFSVYFGLVR